MSPLKRTVSHKKRRDCPLQRDSWHICQLNTIYVLHSSRKIHLLQGSNPRPIVCLALTASASHQVFLSVCREQSLAKKVHAFFKIVTLATSSQSRYCAVISIFVPFWDWTHDLTLLSHSEEASLSHMQALRLVSHTCRLLGLEYGGWWDRRISSNGATSNPKAIELAGRISPGEHTSQMVYYSLISDEPEEIHLIDVKLHPFF